MTKEIINKPISRFFLDLKMHSKTSFGAMVTNILPNIFLCVQQKKEIQVWNYLRVSK